MESYSYQSCINLVGAIIRTAREDFLKVDSRIKHYETKILKYKSMKQINEKKRAKLKSLEEDMANYETAQSFFFNRKRSVTLEQFLIIYGVDKVISADFLRKELLNKISYFNYNNEIDVV